MKTSSTVALWGALTNSSVWVAHGGTLGYALGLVWVGLAALILLVESKRADPTDADLERLTGEPHIDGWPLYSGLPPAAK